jgi:hypothetical protein
MLAKTTSVVLTRSLSIRSTHVKLHFCAIPNVLLQTRAQQIQLMLPFKRTWEENLVFRC